MSKKRKPLRKYRIWVEQVNQSSFDVMAGTPEEAAEKGYTKWRRRYAHSRVSYVQPA